ncbi:unnamed protein product [Haemonchus placei]|uniref:Secreted protein n=1 Tax=Haemonchus placei TaxID=6290 RepID=A0A0N4WXF5_HAEPC|nr:unnamed protein product [Haemonchus placei]
MIWLLLLVSEVHSVLAIEYPWTFDNDLFGGESEFLLLKFLVYQTTMCRSRASSPSSGLITLQLNPD